MLDTSPICIGTYRTYIGVGYASDTNSSLFLEYWGFSAPGQSRGSSTWQWKTATGMRIPDHFWFTAAPCGRASSRFVWSGSQVLVPGNNYYALKIWTVGFLHNPNPFLCSPLHSFSVYAVFNPKPFRWLHALWFFYHMFFLESSTTWIDIKRHIESLLLHWISN